MRLWPFGEKKKSGKGGRATKLNVENLSHLISRGRLDEVFEQVKNLGDAGSAEDYFILFNISLIAGDFERAGRALDNIARVEPEKEDYVDTFRQLLDAELWRQNWRDKAEKRPAVFSDPPAFVKNQCRAWHELINEEQEKAFKSIESVLDTRPAVSGELRTHERDRIRFEDIADADTFSESCLEVLSPGRFFLVPFSDIVSIEMDEPRNIFEAILMPANLKTRSGMDGMVWIPTLYAGSHKDSDSNIRTGNATKWTWLNEGLAVGIGQRTLRILPADEDDEDAEIEVPWKLIRSIRVEDIRY